MALLTQLAHSASALVPLLLPSIAAIIALALLQRFHFFAPNPLSNIPTVGDEEYPGYDKKRQAYLTGKAKDLYLEGYNKFKHGLFRIVTANAGNVIVVSPSFLGELKKLPDDVVSFDAALDDIMHTKYTLIPTHEAVIPHTVKSSLTPSLPRLNPQISEEVQIAFSQEIAPLISQVSESEWAPININSKLLRIVAKVSGRVFIGPELCHDERYLEAAVGYTVSVMEAQRAVEKMKPWLRPFAAWRLPEVKKLAEMEKDATAFLRPVVEARREKQRKGHGEERDNDMLQWLMDSADQGQGKAHGKWGEDTTTTRKLARLQLAISFAAIHTTTLVTTHAVYSLAADKGLQDTLREEVRSVLKEHDGVFTTSALQAMKKTDSFLKETMRFHPLGQTSFSRKVLKTFVLSNGQVMPKGSTIEVPSYAVSRDPEVYANPDVFEPLRFYNLRNEARGKGEVEQAATNQFVSVNKEFLTFGYGRHACPGRFFAANEIKMILANLVMTYEMGLVEGETERYRDWDIAAGTIPDPTRDVMFRKL
ncbi:cytochrome P450 [Copromyces sp. CBS 386.78]|nr:cytochrome P450 [Copromyces sp. CBS 386.78]